MNKIKLNFTQRRIIPISIILIIIAGLVFILYRVSKASSGIPDTNDSKQIQETIINSYKIEQNAAQNFDVSLFPTVFVNDERGGLLSSSTIDFVEKYNSTIHSNYIGYLDYKIAYYNFWGQGAIKIEELRSQAEAEGRNLTSEEMMTLIDEDGRMAAPRSQGYNSQIEILFISILINKNIAKATFDDGPRTNEMTLVKINDTWYIAGNKFISIHP